MLFYSVAISGVKVTVKTCIIKQRAYDSIKAQRLKTSKRERER